MLEDRVQIKTEGLMDYCSRRGFGLLLTDGRHTFRDLKKIKLNRSLERQVLNFLDQGNVIRKRDYKEIIQKCGAKHIDLLRVIMKHDLYYREFPFKLKYGGYNEVFREVFVKGKSYDEISTHISHW